jgi:hypothetical protein
MSPVIRRAASVVVAVAGALIIITLAEGVSGRLYPPPANLDLTSAEVLRQYVESLPVAALLIVLAGYGIAGFVGGWLATRLSNTTLLRPAVAVAAVLLGGSIMNLRAIPHPLWFWLANLLLVVLMPLAGARVASRNLAAG